MFPETFHGEEPETQEQKIFRAKFACKGLYNCADSLICHVYSFKDFSRLGCLVTDLLELYREMQKLHRFSFPWVHLQSPYDNKRGPFTMDLNIWYYDAIFILCGIRNIAKSFMNEMDPSNSKHKLDNLIEKSNYASTELQDILMDYEELWVKDSQVKAITKNKKKSEWKCY